MEWSQWLQGGPYLEVSFLSELKEEKVKKKTIKDIINKQIRLRSLTKTLVKLLIFLITATPLTKRIHKPITYIL